MVAAKCTNCGASIEVDNTKEAGICTHCGTAFITEKVINYYNSYNNFNIANAVFQGSLSEDNLIARAKHFLDNGDFVKAREYVNKVLDLNINNQEALNILNTIANNFLLKAKQYQDNGDYINAKWYANKALEFDSNNQEALNILNKKYFTTLTRTKRLTGRGRVIVENDYKNRYLLGAGDTITVPSSGKINKFILANNYFMPESPITFSKNGVELHSPKYSFLLSFVMKGETAHIEIDTKWGWDITPIIMGHNCESANIIKLH